MKTIKIIDIPKELPYIFRWKDNNYKLDGERYFRVGDNWEPVFFLFQLDEEVEILDEEDEFEEFDTFKSFTCNVGRVDESNIEECIHTLFSQQTSLICNQKKIIEKLNKE